MSPRESVLLLLTAAVALFGISAMLARPKVEEWKTLRISQREVAAEIEAEQELIASRAKWQKEFEELSQYLPRYSATKKMDIHWLSIMDNLAAKHKVRISRRQVGDEKRVGDVYEMPIECRDWEGELEPIVRFLFDMQVQGVMLDIRQIFIKPLKGAKLRGRFTLYCAYTRESSLRNGNGGPGTGSRGGDSGRPPRSDA
jgi:hypothetical protein